MAKKQTVPDEIIISALLACPTLDEAATKCGLSVRQLYTRRQEPDFIQRLREAQSEALENTTRFLQYSTGSAAAALLEIAENREENAQVRVTAARAILEQATRYSEIVDFAERLAAVEHMTKEAANEQ